MSKPQWLKVRVKSDFNKEYIYGILKKYKINTVCNEAACPNMAKCYGRKTASFIIMGQNCTRCCKFCNVLKNKPSELDLEEPKRLADAISETGLKHVVITSVTRDDLIDGGAEHFAKVIKNIRDLNEGIGVEVLIPDLRGNINSLKKIVNTRPDIIAHNMETVPRLYSEVRPEADYKRSLDVLGNIRKIDKTIKVKSGMMLGLGEKKQEVINVLEDLVKIGCDFMTIGQYLAPSKNHYPVKEFIELDIFKDLEKIAYDLGFKYVISEPLARSSYLADQYKV
jgi:lipoic acid synthetase